MAFHFVLDVNDPGFANKIIRSQGQIFNSYEPQEENMIQSDLDPMTNPD